MSSMLKPNVGLLHRFRKKPAHTRVTESRIIGLDTLDHVTADAGLTVDVLKIDTQGTELDVLIGAQRCLAESILCAEVEVSFLQRYEGQPLAHDIIAFMRERGFALIDLHRLKRYRFANASDVGNVGLGGGQRAGQIAYGDAVFVLDTESVQERIASRPQTEAAGLALKLIVTLLVYGKADAAAQCFDLTRDLFDDELQVGFSRWFARLRNAEYGWRGVHLLIDYLARRV